MEEREEDEIIRNRSHSHSIADLQAEVQDIQQKLIIHLNAFDVDMCGERCNCNCAVCVVSLFTPAGSGDSLA